MELSKIEEIANSFKIRASATIELMGAMGLTEKQTARLQELLQRSHDSDAGKDKVKPLTDNMKAEMADLLKKKNNPELPDGAKTHCKKWLKEKLWARREEIKAKAVQKGNTKEEDGFTLMALQLNLGMVYKNTQLHQNDYIIGTDDLFVKGVVYDNKSSWSLDTFPMFETEIPDPRYEWQINSYCDLRKCEDGVLAYTLLDADEEIVERELRWLSNDNEKYKKATNMVFTKETFEVLKYAYFPNAEYNYFIEIPESERIVTFPVKKDQGRVAETYKRVILCREYIKSLLIKKYHGK